MKRGVQGWGGWGNVFSVLHSPALSLGNAEQQGTVSSLLFSPPPPTHPRAPAGAATIAACKSSCAANTRCTGIVTQDAGNGKVSCYFKSDVVLSKCDAGTSFTTRVRRRWVAARGSNCYSGHGAETDIDFHTPCASQVEISECEARCEATEGCDAVVWAGAA